MNTRLSYLVFVFIVSNLIFFSCKPKSDAESSPAAVSAASTAAAEAVLDLSDEQQKKLWKKDEFLLNKQKDGWFLTPTKSENLDEESSEKNSNKNEIELLIDDQGIPLSLAQRFFTPEGNPYYLDEESSSLVMDTKLDPLPISKEILKDIEELDGVEVNIKKLKSQLLSYMTLVLSQMDGVEPSVIKKLTTYANNASKFRKI